MAKNEHGLGTIRTIRDRETKAILGFQALLPRHLSAPPPGVKVKDPHKYQQPVGGRQPTEADARALLNAAIKQQIDIAKLKHGLTLSHYVKQELTDRQHQARRIYELESRALEHTSTFRSIDKVWLSGAPFYEYPPAQIELGALQSWFDWLRNEAKNPRTNKPLSSSFIGSISQLLKATFKRAKIVPNPIASIELPPKDPTKVRFLTLAEQRRFFRSEDIAIEDRVLTGCGMGSGLRIGELLSLEVDDLFLDVPDPHLIVRYGGDHHAPPKGRVIRRVELFEPGLGFFRIWMRDHYLDGARVFGGARDGYRADWPAQFTEARGDALSWSDVLGKHITSHVMRHSYAVAMLSGTWGYPPQSLEFIEQQLRHRDQSTTERYYKGYEAGTWQRHVRQFTGREERPTAARCLTAAELLNLDAVAKLPDVPIDASRAKKLAKTALAANERHWRANSFWRDEGESAATQ